MKGPVLMREYCSISTFPMPQTTDSAKNRKPVAAKGASKRPCLSEGEVERRGGGGNTSLLPETKQKKSSKARHGMR
jgi:hypothetical protein